MKSAWLAFVLSLLSSAADADSFAREFSFSPKFAVGSTYMQVRLLGALELRSVSPTGQSVSELSDLAWDDDEGILYAISDGGALFQFRPRFEDGQLHGLEFIAKHALQTPNGTTLSGVRADAEGLDITNGRNGIRQDAELTVSFERVVRIIRFTPEGRHISPVALPNQLPLASFSSPNKGLEAFSNHPQVQWLTGAEWPRKGASTAHHEIFSAAGKRASFARYPAKASALVGLAALPDGKVVSLERSFDPATASVVIALRLLPAPASWAEGQILHTQTLAEFNSFGDWHVDNFEGLTRHVGNRFFMVSDDNESFLQKTLLVYFELLDQGPSATNN